MHRLIFLFFMSGWMTLHLGCATTQKQALTVTSIPEDALVTVCSAEFKDGSQIKKIAGATPLNKVFEFSKDKPLLLSFEKRGYVGKQVTADMETKTLTVTLEQMIGSDGLPVPPYVMPQIRRIVVAEPKFKIIHRGFSSETVSQKQSENARQELVKAVQRFLGKSFEVVALTPLTDPKRFRTIWRDVKNVLELVHPIRLKFQPEPLLLENKSSRSAVKTLGQQYDADVMIFLSGKQNKETAGMQMGKLGMTVVGTANSYASGYSRAMANGDSFFVYNIYTPQFSQGTALNAVMIDCRTGEIIWANRGGWGVIPFEKPETIDRVMEDLLFGIK